MIKALTVDGTVLKTPNTYNVQYADLDSSNSYTSDKGYLVRDMVRGNQRQISVSWKNLTGPELSKILKKVSGKAKVTLKYWDLYDWNYREGTFYADNRQNTTNPMGLKENTDGSFNLSFTFIEY